MIGMERELGEVSFLGLVMVTLMDMAAMQQLIYWRSVIFAVVLDMVVIGVRMVVILWHN